MAHDIQITTNGNTIRKGWKLTKGEAVNIIKMWKLLNRYPNSNIDIVITK